MKYQKRHKVAPARQILAGGKALRHKGKIRNFVPVCLCASVPDKNGLAPLEITPTSRRSVKSLMGFSFMELMTVVAIMAILIIASMPAFRNFARGKNLKEGTNMVVSALRKTRDAAITYRKNYRVVLDTVNHAVAIYLSGDDTNPAENWKRLPEFVEFPNNPVAYADWDVNKFYDELPLGLGTEDFLYYIEFKTDGGVEGVGVATQNIAILETSTNDTRIIDVNPLTGRIKVEE